MSATYPIYMAPSADFSQRLSDVTDPQMEVTALEFIQWTKSRFSARWKWGKVGEKFTVEFSLGGAEPTLEAIEIRLLDFLKMENEE